MSARTPACPILEDSYQVAGLAHSLRLSIRRLRRGFAACSACPAGAGCPARQAFIDQTYSAIQQVLDDWQAPEYRRTPER